MLARLAATLLVAIAMLAPATAALAPLGLPPAGPDVPTTSAPVAVVDVWTHDSWSWTEGARFKTVQVPADWNRAVLVYHNEPGTDPWDRLFGVSLNGVEVLRGTTIRAEMTLRKDVTEYATLFPAGSNLTVGLRYGTWVGEAFNSVSIEFYNDATAALTPAADAVVGTWLWHGLGGNGARAASSVAFPAAAPQKAVAEITMTGHSTEEFWYIYQVNAQNPRFFHLLVDGVEVARVTPLPYVYALAGFDGIDPTTGLCYCLINNAWIVPQQAGDIPGVHTGTGEIRGYRAELPAEVLPLLTGARTVELVQEKGTGVWITSVSFLLDQ